MLCVKDERMRDAAYYLGGTLKIVDLKKNPT